jgi:sulfur-oxidizing protein SoxZ
MQARIQIPSKVKSGEVIRIGLLIQHPMETGYRTDTNGRKIPKNAIRSLSCTYNGVEVFRAQMSPGVAANPFIQFPTLAAGSGELVFTWIDDAGNRGTAKEKITVAA